MNQIHDIAKEAGTKEPALAVRMVGYEAKMKLGDRKWTSSVQTTSSKAIIDVAKHAIGDLQASAVIIRKNQRLIDDMECNSEKTVNSYTI